jgi:NADH-quinone oxidoreductase subunit A
MARYLQIVRIFATPENRIIDRMNLLQPDATLRLLFPFLITLALALLIPVLMMGLSAILGPKKESRVKMEPYECGVPASTGVLRGKLSVKFFLVAILFLVFDIEVVFLYPWAVVFRQLGMLGFVEMGLFILVLVAGLAYAWKKGALEWE